MEISQISAILMDIQIRSMKKPKVSDIDNFNFNHFKSSNQFNFLNFLDLKLVNFTVFFLEIICANLNTKSSITPIFYSIYCCSLVQEYHNQGMCLI